MTWPDWPKDNAKLLSQYVLPDIAERIKLDIRRDDALARNDRVAIVRAVYDALAKFDLRYARELYHPNDKVQRIRDPEVMRLGSGDATCLDLALLFAGACLGNELLPLVILVDGHAFAAVSLMDDPRSPTSFSRIGRDGEWVRAGLLGPRKGPAGSQDIDTLVAENGNYVPIECTGFAKSAAMSDDVPEGRGRRNGLLDFDAAVKAARAQLKERAFQFAVDPAVLQRDLGYSPYEPSTRNVPEDLRIRLASIFEQHRLFGGRNSELQTLDRFISDHECGYTLVTGDSGSGKSALLANWARRLEARNDVKVAYHFINRQQRLASERDYFRTLCQQIKVLRGEGRDVPAAIEDLQALYLRFITEGLPQRRLIVIIDGLDEVEGWQLAPREFPFPLPRGLYVVISARKTGHDWLAALDLTGKAKVLVLAGLNQEAIADLLRSAGPMATTFSCDVAFVAKLYERSNGDPFYLQFLVKDIAAQVITSLSDLERQPPGVEQYLERWWDEVEASLEHESVRDLLGYLLVARGALTRADLVGLSKDDKLDSFTIDRAIGRVSRYVIGSDKTGYELCHPRFREYISKEKVTAENQTPYRDRLIDFCAGWKEKKSRYATAHYGRHLIDAINLATPRDGDILLARLTQLLTDGEFQRQYMDCGFDFGALELDMKDALHLAVGSERNSIESGVLTSALGLVAARKSWLRPEEIFNLAQAGELDQAERRLALFDVEPKWRQAAIVGIAWSALERDTASARTFLQRHKAELDRDRFGLSLLIDRIFAACAISLEPKLELPYWHPGVPDPVPEHVGRTIVERLGGAVNVSAIGSGPDYQASYVAETDSPFLVALAASQPQLGIPLLKEYIAIHGINPYREYRNRSLWAILGAVLCHPQREIVIDLLRTLVSTALRPGAADYREALLLAIESLAARAGNAASQASLSQRLKQAQSAADSLAPSGALGDAWGHHCRRLAALAEAYAIGLGETASALGCLDRAQDLPRGYAGFQTPASLVLAEANSVCRPGAANNIKAALCAALRSANNIQESSFCATSTARVNSLRRRWWPDDGALGDLSTLIERFVYDPTAPEFAPMFIVGENYAERMCNSEILEISLDVRRANTLESIARHVCQRAISEMLRLNPGIDPAAPLPSGTVVNLPDPGFAPILAARLAAAVLANRNQLDRQCARLICKLVPLATPNPTALDAVLARLLLAEPDLFNNLLVQARAIAPSDWMAEPVPLASVEA